MYQLSLAKIVVKVFMNPVTGTLVEQSHPIQVLSTSVRIASTQVQNPQLKANQVKRMINSRKTVKKIVKLIYLLQVKAQIGEQTILNCPFHLMMTKNMTCLCANYTEEVRAPMVSQVYEK